MLSVEAKQRSRDHLRLSRGLLETAALGLRDSEFDERNALSRSYYSLFHACNALLLAHDVVPSKSHGGMNAQVGKWLGKNFARSVTDAYELRRMADYIAQWRPVRHVSDAKLNVARTNVLWACGEAERKLR
jgi:uncharacterized protein (UPF0332 family)